MRTVEGEISLQQIAHPLSSLATYTSIQLLGMTSVNLLQISIDVLTEKSEIFSLIQIFSHGRLREQVWTYR